MVVVWVATDMEIAWHFLHFELPLDPAPVLLPECLLCHFILLPHVRFTQELKIILVYKPALSVHSIFLYLLDIGLV